MAIIFHKKEIGRVGKYVKKLEPCELLEGMSNEAGAMENSRAVPQIIKNTTTIGSRNLPSRSTSNRPESRNMHCCLHTHVHSHVTHNSQKMEAAHVGSDR